MSCASLPERRAVLDAYGPAVSDGRESLTNTALLTRVRAAARHLRDLGIGPGDVVALKLRNRLDVRAVRGNLRLHHQPRRRAPTCRDGEVAVRGANVMRGYLGRPAETARVIVDGWLRTGDLGRLDADGYLTLVGRSKDMIIRGGENIYPKEIEDVLTGDPSILEAAVIGVPDDRWGEAVIAYVQPRPGLTTDPAALKARCVRHLSAYKRPTAIVVVEAIAKNAVGKIDKGSLRATHLTSRTARD